MNVFFEFRMSVKYETLILKLIIQMLCQLSYVYFDINDFIIYTRTLTANDI